MTIDSSKQSTTVHGLIPLFAIALLAQANPPANRQFPSRADEVRAQREAAEKQEAAKAQAKKQETPPKERANPVESEAEARAVAEKAAHFEKVYRERSARIERLLVIYRKKGDQAKVAELQSMHDKLEKRHQNAMQDFRKELGEQRWAKVEKHWGGPSARALEVRNERANENQAEHEARKAQKEAEGRVEKPQTPPQKKPDENRPKDKPPGQGGKDR